jgi:hypothetical protein
VKAAEERGRELIHRAGEGAPGPGGGGGQPADG